MALPPAIVVAESAFAREFMSLVAQLKNAQTESVLAELVVTGRMDQALELLDQASRKLGLKWSQDFIRTASEFAGYKRLPFDPVRASAVSRARASQFRILQSMSQTQRQATRLAIIEGLTKNLSATEIARLFKHSIGLTPQQMGHVISYRRTLEEGDPRARNRALRDKRFDRSIGRSLSRAQIDRMVERYQERYVAYRARTIATTETTQLEGEAVEEVLEQAVNDGVVNPEKIRRSWITMEDDDVRHTHSTMHGQVRGYQEHFISGGGVLLLHPGDPFAPVKERAGCRCRLQVELAS